MSNYTVTCDCCARKDVEIQGLKNSLEIAHQGLDEFHGQIKRAREWASRKSNAALQRGFVPYWEGCADSYGAMAAFLSESETGEASGG